MNEDDCGECGGPRTVSDPCAGCRIEVNVPKGRCPDCGGTLALVDQVAAGEVEEALSVPIPDGFAEFRCVECNDYYLRPRHSARVTAPEPEMKPGPMPPPARLEYMKMPGRVDIIDCARCGSPIHKRRRVTKFAGSVPEDHPFFSICPTTKHPILIAPEIKVIKNEDGQKRRPRAERQA